MSKFTLNVDSSQIATFLECPQLWAYSYLERLGLPHLQEKNEKMNAGTYGHKLLEIYYLSRLKGKTLNEAMEEAFSWNPDEETCECGCRKEEHKDFTLENSPDISLIACTKCAVKLIPCIGFKPVPYALAQDQRIAVRQRLREYFYTYVNNDFLPNNEQAVEVGFSEPIYEDDENLFVLEGRIDMIGTLQGLPCIIDHKFQFSAKPLYKKKIQFKNYALVSRLPMLIVNYVRLTKGVSKDTLVRDPVTFTAQETHLWKKRLIDIFFQIKQEVQKAEERGFTKNWSACDGRFGYPCIYAPLCEEFNPEMIPIKKQQLYVIKEAWSPWT